MNFVSAYVGLGSNVGDSVDLLNRALTAMTALPDTRVVQCSAFYRNPAIGPQQPDYVNAVAELITALGPRELLKHLQSIETHHGRDRRREERWGPRTLDLDILLYGDRTMDTEELVLPHPQMTRRAFVLWPLAEIAPDLRLPDGQSVKALAQTTDASQLKRLAT
jgi:2-amino-4-hydroxy-6-hydroxymethyldihydropteridine diphosphokinase